MTSNAPLVVTVSQLNRRIALMLKNDRSFVNLSVQGEISDLTFHAKTGHIFFSLKDEACSVKAIMFRSDAEKLTFMPLEGMSVIVVGNVQCFERDGVYQIYVHEIIPRGAGEQAEAYQLLKEKLKNEGIFSQKRPRPPFPRNICVITAETGAALQDILNILDRRDPLVKVTLIPALVQGSGAPDSICKALLLANDTDADLIIFGRGGGSAEDLSAFDTEQVARAVYNSRIPTISAVGHETDFCLADLAADERAPTPSAAAELAVPDREDIIEITESALYTVKMQLSALISGKESKAAELFSKIQLKSPRQKLLMNEKLVEAKRQEISASVKRLIERKDHLLAERAAVISALDPLAVLTRGYSIVYKDNDAVSKASQLSEGDNITIRLSDGTAQAVVAGVNKNKDVQI